VTALLLAACTAKIDPVGGSQSAPPPGRESGWAATRFVCGAGGAAAELPLRRLSRVQYQNTVAALVAESGLGAAEQQAVLTALQPDLAGVPADRLVGVPGEARGGFYRLDQTIQQAQVDASYQVATRLGAELTSSPARIAAVVGACATNAATDDDGACFSAFAERFGRLALRRPLRAGDRTLLQAVVGTTPVAPAALADAVALLAAMPQALYHVEEGDPAAGGPTALDAHALASRLSYHLWQAPPDAALRAAADSGAILTPDGYRAQVQRLLADPRVEEGVRTFFAEWFRLHELTPLDSFAGTPLFDAFAGYRPGADLHVQMSDEIGDVVVWHLRRGGTVADVLTDRRQFARTAELAGIYGGVPWDGTSVPTALPEAARAGLVTRGALLANASGNTRPIMKGQKVRNALACLPIPPPPAGFTPPAINLSPTMTTREVLEAMTETPGGACAACHSTYLNPLGYLTEDFDALGRHRTRQVLFNPDATVAGSKPVNTSAAPNVAGVTTPIPDARALTELLQRSGEFETCFARQYFRFTFQRVEDDAADGCVLRSLQDAAATGQRLDEVLASVALRPEFKRRDLR
jgi:hypothetical protein